jgi:hypothetical protein
MTFGLIKNVSRHNKGEDINSDLRYVPCQRKKHSCSHFNNNLFIIIESNYFLKLKCLLEKDNFCWQICKRENNLLEFIPIEMNY